MAPHAPRLRAVRSVQAGRDTAVPNTRRSILGTIFITIASIVVALVGVVPAQADPSIAEIEAKIDDAWHELEPIIEKHNATRQDLAAKRKKADALAKKIAPLELQVSLAMDKVGQFAVRAYMGDKASALNAILTTGTPATLVDQLEVLDQFARRQQEDVRAVVELKERYESQKAPLDVLVAQLTEEEADLKAKRKQIDADIAKFQKMRIEAYGGSGSLGSLRPVPCPPTYPGGDIGKVVKWACSQIGKPYVWGADGPGSYDCSGLTMRAWEQVGVYLPHNAARQRGVIPSVSRANLRPGDLVFYSGLTHVALYVGNGWVVHAPTSGDRVRMRKVDVGTIHSYGRPG